MDREYVAGRNIKPVSHELIAKLANDRKLPQIVENMSNSVGVSHNIECVEEDQQCLNESFINDIIDNEQHEVSDNMTVEENECATCLKQFYDKSTFRKHAKKGDCKEIICKREHNHDYKIIKFDTAEALREFGKSFGTQFHVKTPPSKIDIKATCREKGCPAHWNSKETKRPSGKVDYIFRGCISHASDCKHHEDNQG